MGASLSGRCLVVPWPDREYRSQLWFNQSAFRPLEWNPSCPAACPWFLINVLLTSGEAIQPVFQFHLASEIIIFGIAPSTPLENIIFGTNGKIVHSYLQDGGVPALHIAYFEISLWEVITTNYSVGLTDRGHLVRFPDPLVKSEPSELGNQTRGHSTCPDWIDL